MGETIANEMGKKSKKEIMAEKKAAKAKLGGDQKVQEYATSVLVQEDLPRAVHGLAISQQHLAGLSFHAKIDKERSDLVRVWSLDASDGAVVAQLPTENAPPKPEQSGQAACFTRQGDRLVLGDGGNVKIIDSLEQAVEGAGGTWRCRVICGDPDAEAGSVQVRSVAVSDSGALMAAGMQDGSVYIYSTKGGDTAGSTVEVMPDAAPSVLGGADAGDDPAVLALCFVGDTTLFSGNTEGAITIWSGPSNGKSWKEIEELDDVHTKDIRALASAAGASIVAAGSADCTATLWQLESGTVTPRGVLRGHTERLNSCCLSDGARVLATASKDKTIRLWDVQAALGIAVLKGHGAGVNSCLFSPGLQYIYSAGEDKSIRSWGHGDLLSLLSPFQSDGGAAGEESTLEE